MGTRAPQPGSQCRGLPVPVRYRGPAALATQCASAQSRHLGGRTGLVDEHQPVGIEIELAVEPEPSGDQHVFAFLLGGVCGLFLNVMARFLKKCQTVEGAAQMLCSPASRSAIS